MKGSKDSCIQERCPVGWLLNAKSGSRKSFPFDRPSKLNLKASQRGQGLQGDFDFSFCTFL